MFLSGDKRETREARIRRWFTQEPSVGLLLACVHFEWAVRRTLIRLSKKPNIVLWRELEWTSGLQKYKRKWLAETAHIPGTRPLDEVISDWPRFEEAFANRNVLAHGRDRRPRSKARPHLEKLLSAVAELEEYCRGLGINPESRLPVRRASHPDAPMRERRRTQAT